MIFSLFASTSYKERDTENKSTDVKHLKSLVVYIAAKSRPTIRIAAVGKTCSILAVVCLFLLCTITKSYYSIQELTETGLSKICRPKPF